MELRTDTVGHTLNPTDADVERAFKPHDATPANNDIIKLEHEGGDYLAAHYIADAVACRVVLRREGFQAQITQKIPLEETIQLFRRYRRNDLSWTQQFQWEKAFGQKMKEAFGYA